MFEFFGYDAPPAAVEASSTVMANNGAPKLASFLNGIDAAREHGAGDAHITVAGHSYGSTTAGIAATLVNDGVIDDLVQFGSPGSGVQDVGEFHVPEGHTYVSAACNELLTAENFTAYKNGYQIDAYSKGGETICSFQSRTFSSPSWTRTISATPTTSTCCPSDSNSPNNAGHRAASNS